jgi:two-component system, NtrC family, sensor histidine kinase PilS
MRPHSRTASSAARSTRNLDRLHSVQASRQRRLEVGTGYLWKALRYFNLYRLIIAGLFTLLGALRSLPPTFAQVDTRLLTFSAGSYLIAAIGLQIAIERRWPSPNAVRNSQVVIDIVALTLFMHASGGVEGGFGILLVVAVAGACLIAAWRAALIFAALATLAALAETAFGSIYLGYTAASYTQAGLLGATLFATAVLASILAEQARRSEVLAEERAVALEQMSQLNEHIVQRMRSGIVVLDADLKPVLVNAAAGRVLGRDSANAKQRLAPIEGVIANACRDWQARGENRKAPWTLDSGAEVIVSFTQLGNEAGGNTLAFVEDAAEMQQRAQQLKLASLGRLTASIAHEIRNPLGAISHAAQLLSESPALDQGDRRLTQIVNDHAGRMNEIIKNVMMIGRRDRAIAESFALRAWLEPFVAELRERFALREPAVVTTWLEPDMILRIDRSQLQQVLWNLCENALRYSQSDPKLRFICGRAGDSGRPYVDVIDTGPGMTATVAEQVFEPFFTGETTGTGLGLYLARELCEANQASLTLLEHAAKGCRFRILFAHPERQQLSALR